MIERAAGCEFARDSTAQAGVFRPQVFPTSLPHPSPQAPNSPCNQFVNQVRQQASAIVGSTCDKPVTVSTKPTPQCCELAQRFAPCRCDSDVHRTSGKDLAVATYRSTQAGCGGKCVEPNAVGC